MARLTLWYSVGNGGDGSAYPQWFESERLTEMDQELMSEGWGECCNGSITIEGDNMKPVGMFITTKQEFIKELDDIIDSDYRSKGEKKTAKEFKEELLNEIEGNDFNAGNIKWYKNNDELEEKIKSFNEFI